jgi:hypothetical protein
MGVSACVSCSLVGVLVRLCACALVRLCACVLVCASVTQDLFVQLKALAESNKDVLMKHRKLVSDFNEASSATEVPAYTGSSTPSGGGLGDVSESGKGGSSAAASPAAAGGDKPYHLLVEAGYSRRDSVSTYTVSSTSSSSRCGGTCSCAVEPRPVVPPVMHWRWTDCFFFVNCDWLVSSDDNSEDMATEGRKVSHWVFELDDADQEDMQAVLASRTPPPVRPFRALRPPSPLCGFGGPTPPRSH